MLHPLLKEKDYQLQVGCWITNMFNESLKFYQAKLFSKVIDLYKEEERDVRVLELVGLSALKIDNFKLAYSIFSKLIIINPNNANNFHFGLSCLNLGLFNEAKKAFLQSSKDPGFEIASKLNYSHCLIKLGSITEAEASLKELTVKSPIVPQSWFMLLDYYRKSLDLINLRETLTKSKPYIENNILWKKSYASLLFYSNSFQKTIDYINSLQSNIDDRLKVVLAKSYVKTAKFEKAIEIYKELVKEKRTIFNLYNIAAAYSNLTSHTDLNKAIDYADKCLVLDRYHHQAHYCKALSFQKLGRHELAIENINEAIGYSNGNIQYLYTKAELLNSLNKNIDSLTVLNEVLKLDANYFQAYRLKGLIELQSNKLSASEVNLLKAVELDSTDQRSIAYYSIAQLAQSKKQQVKKFLSLDTFVKEYYFDPTPDYQTLGDFNRDLANDIKNHSILRKEPFGLAARNGYLTDDIFKDQTKAIKLFKKLLLDKINSYINQLPQDLKHHMLRHKTNDFHINAWATLVQGDGFIDKHIHEESWLSGAYYCCVPKVTGTTDEQQGYFEYGCIPDNIQIDIDKDRGFIKPIEGKIVMFPSYLYHQTIPHETKEDRISVAFDLTPNVWKK